MAISADRHQTGASFERDRVRREGARNWQSSSTNGATGLIRIAPTF